MASLDALDLEACVAGRADSPVDPAMVAERRERRASIAAAVNALPDGQRLVTVLFYVGGYPQHEIAEVLNIPLTTVKKRLQAARRQLHERLMTLMKMMARAVRRRLPALSDGGLLANGAHFDQFRLAPNARAVAHRRPGRKCA